MDCEKITLTGNSMTLRIPKQIALVKLCGGIVFHIDDMSEFIMPTEEQRKNLKETFCIEVIPLEQEK